MSVSNCEVRMNGNMIHVKECFIASVSVLNKPIPSIMEYLRVKLKMEACLTGEACALWWEGAVLCYLWLGRVPRVYNEDVDDTP